MCFSAAAIFTASAGLCALGTASLQKVETRDQYPFATIPFVFALQQFEEGLVWISLNQEGWNHYTMPLSMAFLMIAQVVWPL